MSEDCCERSTRSTSQESIGLCPLCGKKSRRVDIQTVKAFLSVSLTALQADEYRFCTTPECAIVYFSGDGHERYREDELRQPVHQKHPDDEHVSVCYCFRHTPATIRAELQTKGTSTVIREINAGIRAGQCACEIRNPQGSCCLGNVTAVVKRIRAQPATRSG